MTRVPKTQTTSLFGCLALAATVAVGAAGLGGAPLMAAPGGAAPMGGSVERGVTRPSDERKLVFAGPGVVGKVDIKDGDPVKAGQSLALQDDRVERKQLEANAAEIVGAEIKVRASVADLENKKIDLRRKEIVYADDIKQGRSNAELDEARLAVTIGAIQVEFSKHEKSSKQLETTMHQVKLDQKSLLSPIEGIVAKLDARAGEGTDLTKPAIVIVKNDPLWVEVNVPTAKARALQTKQPLQVRYADEEQWQQAEILVKFPVADAAASVQRLRLQLANPTNRESGLPVVVKLPETPGAGTAASAR